MNPERHYYTESFDTVALVPYRISRSPFAHRYTTPDTVHAVYCNRLYPMKSSPDENTIGDYWKLRRGVLLYDVPEQPLSIQGPDAARLLERVLACRVTDLGIGRCRYGLACDDDGSILMDGVLMRLGEDRFWYVIANGDFLSWLKAHAIGLDVEVCDPGSRVVQIQGPKSLDVADAAIAGGLPADLRYFRAGFFEVCGQTLWVSRTGWTGEAGIEIYCNSGTEPTDHDALWDGLFAAGEPFGMEFGTGSSMGIRRIEAGILDNGSDIEPDLTPFGAGLGQFVRLDKPDFIGKSALERSDRSQLLFGLICPTAMPEPDMVVSHADRPVGHVTIGTWSPTLDTGVGYVRFEAPIEGGEWLARHVRLHDHEDSSHAANVVALPFVDEDKQLPRVVWGGPGSGTGAGAG